MVKEFNAAQWLAQGMKIFKRELLTHLQSIVERDNIKPIDGKYTVLIKSIMCAFVFELNKPNSISVRVYEREGDYIILNCVEMLHFDTIQRIAEKELN